MEVENEPKRLGTDAQSRETADANPNVVVELRRLHRVRESATNS